MSQEISFKSFYYSLGTTSFRMQNFNKKIEQQLDLLNEFWKLSENQNESWEANEKIQEAYYDFLKKNNFIEGDAPRKAKDARQKTSGMRDIGLITDDRKLTEVGKRLLELSKSNDFTSDNFLQIPKDSFIYFQQLLKTYLQVNSENGVRPFIVLARLLRKFGYLHQYEFTYLFPLCINEDVTNYIETRLSQNRTKESVDSIITNIFMQNDNYRDSLIFFLKEKDLTEETFCKIGLNRKSKDFDKPYFKFYNALKTIYLENEINEATILKVYEASGIGNVSAHWRKFLFKTTSAASIRKSPLENFEQTNMFSNCNTEADFKTIFFKTMHLIKIKRTLEDYFDLNRRYLKISDTLLFSDNQVKFDVIPKYYFSLLPDSFYGLAFKKSENLCSLKTLEEISPFLKFNEANLLKAINKDYKTAFRQIGEIKKFVQDERLERFNKLIDEKFTDEKLITILELFKKRTSPIDDKKIQDIVTDEADGPTIFEYILAIAWYKICERKGNILSFMNLSLEADLLPKTHAGSGEADIVWKYEKTKDFPKHNLLIEATLADSTNQRKMEMEPVSRHLGNYLLENQEHEAYCVFVTNNLNINVISDFRGRKSIPFYNSDGSKNVPGMMINPIETDVLVSILKSGKKYAEIYKIFHSHFENSLAPKEWYEELKNKLCR